MKTLMLAFIPLIISSCGTSRLSDPRALSAIRNTKVYSSLKDDQYYVIQRIEGISCGKTWSDLSSEEDAIQDLKANTKDLNKKFDGITNVICENTGFSLVNNCNNSITCYADVITFTNKITEESNKITSGINEYSTKCDERNPKYCYLAGTYLYKNSQLEDSIFYFQQACLMQFNDSCELAREIMKEKIARDNRNAVVEIEQQKKNALKFQAQNAARLQMQRDFGNAIPKPAQKHEIDLNIKANCKSTNSYSSIQTNCD
jgi:hypothetical protein